MRLGIDRSPVSISILPYLLATLRKEPVQQKSCSAKPDALQPRIRCKMPLRGVALTPRAPVLPDSCVFPRSSYAVGANPMRGAPCALRLELRAAYAGKSDERSSDSCRSCWRLLFSTKFTASTFPDERFHPVANRGCSAFTAAGTVQDSHLVPSTSRKQSSHHPRNAGVDHHQPALSKAA